MAEIICVTGMDGAGKNTLINLLSEQLKSVVIANIWDIMEGGISTIPFNSKKDIDMYLCELTPDARLLFLAHALKYSVDEALKSAKKYVLLNAYYFKYFATEATLGSNKQLIKSLIQSFPVPNKVLFLDIPIEEAAKRKVNFSRYECGLITNPQTNDFIDFQTKVSLFWDSYDKKDWAVLDASLSPNELCEQSLAIIRNK